MNKRRMNGCRGPNAASPLIQTTPPERGRCLTRRWFPSAPRRTTTTTSLKLLRRKRAAEFYPKRAHNRLLLSAATYRGLQPSGGRSRSFNHTISINDALFSKSLLRFTVKRRAQWGVLASHSRSTASTASALLSPSPLSPHSALLHPYVTVEETETA
ncbi:hypothetical protein AOLI_G00019210 [Acnodon oligacanthus]